VATLFAHDVNLAALPTVRHFRALQTLPDCHENMGLWGLQIIYFLLEKLGFYTQFNAIFLNIKKK